MRGDLPDAALRLLATLPVRTNLAPEPEKRVIGKPLCPGAVGFEKGKPIRIRGQVFASHAEARKTLHLSSQTIYKMVARNEAEYV